MLAEVSVQETPPKTIVFEKKIFNMKHSLALDGNSKPVVTVV